MNFLTQNEALIRLGVFAIMVVTMGLIELIRPRRVLSVSKSKRWMTNFAIVLIDVLTVRVLLPVLPLAVAFWGEAQGFGLLKIVAMPKVMNILVTILALDLVIYFQHRGFHRLPFLWRFHKVHHTDMDLDVSSGFRFHPVEILLSLAIKISAVFVLGADPVGVVLFEVILNLTSLFNHSNIYLPPWIDRSLRLFLVTPDMHRVHHSVIPGETDSNFCFNFPWWDRVFRTYRDQPQAGHTRMTIGLHQHQDASELTLFKIMLLPFK